MPIRSMKIDEFQPHPSETDAVSCLAELRCRFALDAHGRVYHVLISRGFSDQDASLLQELPHLTQFCGGYHPPGQGDFTADGFSQVLRHQRLERFTFQGNLALNDDAVSDAFAIGLVPYLGLPQTAITDAGVESLARYRDLQGLSLIGTSVSDQSVPFLCEMRNLTELYIANTNISKESIATLQSWLPECRIVS